MKHKYTEAIGIFWGASFFLGLLIAICIGFFTGSWIVAASIGACLFLILGLSVQGIVTLFSKNNSKPEC